MTAIDAGILLTIVGALVTFYLNMNKKIDDRTDKLSARQEKLEDCVEDQVGELATQLRFFREAQRDFQEKVVERLSAIETRLSGGFKSQGRS